MTEKLDIYDLMGKHLGTQERKQYYSEIKQEFKKTGSITRQIKSIRLLLMNSKGRIYLQKRSKLKDENSGLYDKTVGGHVSAGDSYDMTVIRECAEELGFPATILSPKEFKRATKVTDLSVIGIFRKVDLISDFQSTRINKDGSRFIQPLITQFYFGYYNGAIKFVDGECSGIEVFSIDELKQEIKKRPYAFTEDIKFMIKKYNKFIHAL
ncbi:MAG: NUDIX domain-containing protein [archaeon]